MYSTPPFALLGDPVSYITSEIHSTLPDYLQDLVALIASMIASRNNMKAWRSTA